jgi:hypothetical protein
MPLKYCDHSPNPRESVMKSLTCPKSAGAMSYNPEIVYPPPSGSLGSSGAVMLYAV